MTKQSTLSANQPQCWFVYMIETDKQNLYTGITTDLERRFQEHLNTHLGTNKKGAKFFRSQKPIKLCYSEQFSSRSGASKREAEIKKLSHQQKIELANYN